jgi:hypothetical protein
LSHHSGNSLQGGAEASRVAEQFTQSWVQQDSQVSHVSLLA